MRKEGKLFVISGPSGVGKDTVITHLLNKNDNVALSISCTTRAPRGEGKDGVDYYFKNHEQFEQMIEEDGFLEYAKIFDNYYGTPVGAVKEKKLQQGLDVILEIDVQGAINVRKSARRCARIHRPTQHGSAEKKGFWAAKPKRPNRWKSALPGLPAR